MNVRARLMAIAWLVGAAACQQVPQPAAPPAAAAGSARSRVASTALFDGTWKLPDVEVTK